MLFLRANILLIFVIIGCTDSSDEDVYNQVRADQLRARSLRKTAAESTDWLPNCGKIALGFDPVQGEPDCYTGECRANGFNQPIFDMQYVKSPEGSCVTKMIPENVNINCIQTTDQQSRTEKISDFRQLANSMADGASWQVGFGSLARSQQQATSDSDGSQGRVGAGAGALLGVVGTLGSILTETGPLASIVGAVKPSGGLVRGVSTGGLAGRAATIGIISSFGLSFGGSSETRSMVTNLVNYESSIYFSTAKMTTVELSLYAPKAQLSAEFRHAIENLPCCDMTPIREQYIYDNILSNFGSTFLTSIVLGGIAQSTITIKNVALNSMNDNGQSASNFANLAFAQVFKFGTQSMSDNEQAAYNNFTRLITTSQFTTQGGSIYNRDQSLNEWFSTIPDNPIITSFKILPIFDLLTQEENRFPNDSQIYNKSIMIATVLEKIYNNTNVFCENDCSGRGECVYTGYFMYGFCNCNFPWSGIDCSVYNPNATTHSTEPPTTAGRMFTTQLSFTGRKK